MWIGAGLQEQAEALELPRGRGMMEGGIAVVIVGERRARVRGIEEVREEPRCAVFGGMHEL